MKTVVIWVYYSTPNANLTKLKIVKKKQKRNYSKLILQ
jgi:hypothetical protein